MFGWISHRFKKSPLPSMTGSAGGFNAATLSGRSTSACNQIVPSVVSTTAPSVVDEDHFKSIFQKNSSVMLLIDPQSGLIIDANKAAENYYGNEPLALIGRSIASINTLSAERIAEEMRNSQLENRTHFFFKHRLASGEIREVEVYSTPIHSGGRSLLFSIVHDITARKRAEQQLQLVANVFTHAREGVMITAANGQIIDVNQSFSRITGYARDEVIGETPRLFKSDRHLTEFYAQMWSTLRETDQWIGEVWNRRKNGEVYAEAKNISAVRDRHGELLYYVALFSDITVFKHHAVALQQAAHYDALTGLPNRVLLAERMQQAMTYARAHAQRLAVAYLDLDGFKPINDGHGHAVGDQLLKQLAGRMKQVLPEGDTFARLGGDEFVAVFVDADASRLTQLLAAAALPVQIGELSLRVSASLGVTYYPQADEVEADQLLRQADQAMYQAKLGGKNRYHVFDAEKDRSVRGHNESLDRIADALAAREFVLYYQPKVNMRTGIVIGAEALIRWQHPQRGLLSPAVFLPLIENHSLAIDIGEWVIDTALSQVAVWRAAGMDLSISVNIGARQLQHAEFVPRLRTILAAHPDFQAGDLEMEVLETSALEDVVRVSDVIDACRQLGISFSLDDFGTGYSSLTYLKRLPVAQLKIDQTFVRDMLDDPDDLAILEGIIGMATAFRRQVIAEGIETVAQGHMLLQLGCEHGQGYGIARPMPAEAFAGWVKQWTPDPSWLGQGPVSRHDLPLLFAGVEHHAWLQAIDRYLCDGVGKLPALDAQHCHFGRWLESEGVARYGGSFAFAQLMRAHQEMHSLAARCCHLHDHDQSASVALDALGELQREFTRSLKSIERETSDRIDEKSHHTASTKIAGVG